MLSHLDNGEATSWGNCSPSERYGRDPDGSKTMAKGKPGPWEVMSHTHETCPWGGVQPQDWGHLSQGWLLHSVGPLHTCLGLALEVEGQYILPRPSLTLADHKEAVAPGPAC